MAEGIVYLDVDDEITSAAARIRTAPGTKVALVVPMGSRIATSRMNFRLLSREALVNNRRLSIVSGDAAARSLAASAGLPVFGTVPEYEAAIARPAADPGPDQPATRTPLVDPAIAGDLAASETVVAAGRPEPADGAGTAATAPIDPVPARKSQLPRRPPPEPLTATTPAAPAELGDVDRPAAGGGRDRLSEEEAWLARDAVERPNGRNRASLLAGLGLVGLAAVVLAVGGYLFLPAATIALTPRRDPIGPITLTVAADPNATEVDAANSIVPAVRVDVPVDASRTFTTTGIHVVESAARGAVTFTNYDTSSGVSIPSGSVVSTEGGTGFRTQGTVVLQAAAVFPAFQPTSDSVQITAVKAGDTGNVPANTIRVVPQGQDPVLLRVNNPSPTSGGTHTETPQVTKAEVDKAVAALQADLGKAFTAAVAAGAGAPPDTKLFSETAVLGASTPDPDPKTIVGQAIATFDLKLTATGTAIAVDPRPVATIARSQLDAQVAKGHRLVADSVLIDVGAGTVGEDGQVTFQATARATQVAIVDANALRNLVKGKTAAEARAALVQYGTATVTLWPDWVSTVTSVDARLSVTIDEGPAVSGEPAGSPASSSPPRRTAAPTGSATTGPPPSGAPSASASARASSAP